MVHCCFKQGCELEAKYVCECLSSLIYSCKSHLQQHLQLPYRSHSLNSVLAEPSELTLEEILKFLAKEKAKKEKLKRIAFASFNQNSENRKNNIKISLNDLNSDLEEISCLIEKVSQFSEEDPLWNALKLQHDTGISEEIPASGSEKCNGVTLFCLHQLSMKWYQMFSKTNNDPEVEQDFRSTCSLYKKYTSNSYIRQAYKIYIKEYQKFTSLYLISNNGNLHIYNTETEKEKKKVKVLEDKLIIRSSSFLTQLPNDDLFFVNSKNSFAFILDEHYWIRTLPDGLPDQCLGGIYFDRSVYCFGQKVFNTLNPPRRFDLDKNRWTSLSMMCEDRHNYLNIVVFNRNILITTDYNSKIFLYSIDIDSFSEIPYRFAKEKKILINGKERLYLIECRGSIYESKDEYNWKWITKSIIEDDPEQVYCSYNKSGIYISILYNKSRAYFKFDLNRKKLFDISLYGKKLGLKRSGDKLKAIKRYENTFKLDPNHAAIYADKGFTLYYIIKKIEKNNKKIDRYKNRKDSKHYAIAWGQKGGNLMSIGRNLEAIECYNEAIRINSNRLKKLYDDKKLKIKGVLVSDYITIGIVLVDLGRPLEAIKYYDEAIKLESDNGNIYFHKGNALEKGNRHLEAIECYKKAISLNSDTHWIELDNNIRISLQNLERNLEAIGYYNEGIKYNPNYADSYNNKGNALLKIGKCAEAIEFYNDCANFI